jgi:hypothetical protein
MSNDTKNDVSNSGQGVYYQALEKAQNELATLREERRKIDGRIAKLEQTVKGLAAICEEQHAEIPPELPMPPEIVDVDDVTGLGLTGAIRKILSSREYPMMATEVRDALAESGMDITKYSNALVAVHNTLKRLFDQGELAKSQDDPIRYLWVNAWTRVMRETTRTMDSMRPTEIPKGFILK